MKIIIVKEKHSNRAFDVSTPELRSEVFLKLFKERNKLRYYHDLKDIKSLLYYDALKGDAKSAEKIIVLRSSSGYEYERIEELVIENR